MRAKVLSMLMAIAEKDTSMVLLTGDLGFGLFEPFIEKFPEQFFNLGIAEQNMIGVAAGLALSGKSVFVYSIGNFPSFRCLEQIRNDLCYHNLNVNIIALGGGFNYGGLGMSHHATEDLSVMRAIPNLTVVAPSNANDAATAVSLLHKTPGPSYLRLEKCGINSFTDQKLFIGKATHINKGEDCCIVATGSIAKEAVEAAKQLKNEQNIDCQVIDMHTIKPMDVEQCELLIKNHKLIITLEENSIIGGLYGAIAEVAARIQSNCLIVPMGIKDHYSHIVGDQQFLRNYYQLNSQAIVDLITSKIKT